MPTNWVNIKLNNVQRGSVIVLTHFASLFGVLQKNVLDESCKDFCSKAPFISFCAW